MFPEPFGSGAASASVALEQNRDSLASAVRHVAFATCHCGPRVFVLTFVFRSAAAPRRFYVSRAAASFAPVAAAAPVGVPLSTKITRNIVRCAFWGETKELKTENDQHLKPSL